jgi:hypothetical protein
MQLCIGGLYLRTYLTLVAVDGQTYWPILPIAVSACNSLAAMPATTFPKSYKEMLLLSQYTRPASAGTCNKYTWRQIAQDKVAVLPGI